MKIKTEHGQNKRNEIQLATGINRVHIDAGPVCSTILVRSYYNSTVRSYVNRSWKAYAQNQTNPHFSTSVERIELRVRVMKKKSGLELLSLR